jgi:hypothetical protein
MQRCKMVLKYKISNGSETLNLSNTGTVGSNYAGGIWMFCVSQCDGPMPGKMRFAETSKEL